MYKILVIMYSSNMNAKTMHSQDLSFDYKDSANKAYDILAEKMRSSDHIKEVIKLY